MRLWFQESEGVHTGLRHYCQLLVRVRHREGLGDDLYGVKEPEEGGDERGYVTVIYMLFD